MQLTDDEKAIRDGSEGEARAHAMDLLVRYGIALGAERLVDTNSVCGGVVGSLPGRRDILPEDQRMDMDAVFSLLNLDSDKRLEIPRVKTMSYKLIDAVDMEKADIQRVPLKTQVLAKNVGDFCTRVGINKCNTCAPYQIGNVPVYGEHCAWMESSAVIYINSLLGARSNVEGAHSTAAASLVGKIPYWGYHTPEGRKADYVIDFTYDVQTMLEWGLAGYYIGEKVQEHTPVINGVTHTPHANNLKHFGAAAASAGGVEMFHMPGITPEAQNEAHALGPNKAIERIEFGRAQLEEAYGYFNTATDTDVDFIVIGCPHASLDQVKRVAELLDGKHLSANTDLWIFTPRALKTMATRMGYTESIERAGAHVMSDSCAALSKVYPKGVKVAATDSCKQAHYLPAILGFQTWLGSTEDCVNAALTGKWTGTLA